MSTDSNTTTGTGELHAFLLNKGYHAIPFIKNAVGHLLVDIIINGEKGSFILDTGASATIVDTKQASRLQLVLQTDDATFEGAGAGGQGLEVIPSKGNRLEIGSYLLPDYPLLVMSLFANITQVFEQAGVHEELSGVLGVDILIPGKAVIDYSSMTLYLLPTEQ